MKSSSHLTIKTILFGFKEFELYNSLINPINQENMVIGRGEAACIAPTKIENGILASNNLRDIMCYVKKFSLEHITIGDILVEAYMKNLITEKYANNI